MTAELNEPRPRASLPFAADQPAKAPAERASWFASDQFATVVVIAVIVVLMQIGSAILLLAGSARAEVIQIRIEKIAFAPQQISTHVGDTIEWVNADIVAHTATARNGAWDVMLPPDSTRRVALKAVGIWSDRDRAMTGRPLLQCMTQLLAPSRQPGMSAATVANGVKADKFSRCESAVALTGPSRIQSGRWAQRCATPRVDTRSSGRAP